MKIYTSYFGNLDVLKENDIVPVGICCYPPKWFNGINISMVAPTPYILENYKGKPEEYEEAYRSTVLSIIKDIDVLTDRLEFFGKGKDVALCCYERPEDFCHRHILADFINKHSTKYKVEEYPKHKQKIESYQLF